MDSLSCSFTSISSLCNIHSSGVLLIVKLNSRKSIRQLCVERSLFNTKWALFNNIIARTCYILMRWCWRLQVLKYIRVYMKLSLAYMTITTVCKSSNICYLGFGDRKKIKWNFLYMRQQIGEIEVLKYWI
jgi:hypothetical protein